MHTVITLIIVFGLCGLNTSYASAPLTPSQIESRGSKTTVHEVENTDRGETNDRGNVDERGNKIGPYEQRDTTHVRIGPKTWVPLPTRAAHPGATTWVNVPITNERRAADPLTEAGQAICEATELHSDVVVPPKRRRRRRLSASHSTTWVNIQASPETEVEFVCDVEVANPQRKRRPNENQRVMPPPSHGNNTPRTRKTKQYTVWKLIYDKLSSSDTEELVRWEDEDEMIFRIVNRTRLAEEWEPLSGTKSIHTEKTLINSLNHCIHQGTLFCTSEQRVLRFANIPTVLEYIASTKGTTPAPAPAPSTGGE